MIHRNTVMQVLLRGCTWSKVFDLSIQTILIPCWLFRRPPELFCVSIIFKDTSSFRNILWCKLWLNLARHVNQASAHWVRPFVGCGLGGTLFAKEKRFHSGNCFVNWEDFKFLVTNILQSYRSKSEIKDNILIKCWYILGKAVMIQGRENSLSSIKVVSTFSKECIYS